MEIAKCSIERWTKGYKRREIDSI